MSKYTINQSNVFKKELKIAFKRNYDLSKLQSVVHLLANGEILPPEYKDHPLKGKFDGYRDCHILQDWVLIYRYDKKELILLLFRTGTHSDLFD